MTSEKKVETLLNLKKSTFQSQIVKNFEYCSECA